MTKLIVDMTTYAAVSQALERAGRTINDGKPLTIEKGEAIMPPVDFKSAGIRQNCLIAASNAWPKDKEITPLHFINFCENLFNWVLKGDKPELPKLAEPTNTPSTGWGATTQPNKGN